MLQDLATRIRWSAKQLGRPDLRTKIFFLHIPKCGGTSLISAMRQHYMTLSPRDDRFVAHLNDAAALKAATLLGRSPLAYNREISLYYLAGRYRYISGHFAFHRLAYETFGQEYAFVTMLRDPVKKWLSLYFFNRYKQGDHYSVDDDLEAFLETDLAAGYGSDYAMQFAGDDRPQDYTSAKAVERAIENLKLFHLVGLVEEMPLFVREFKEVFDVELDIPVMRTNPVSREAQQEMVTPQIMARIRELNEPNMAIYNYVREELIGTYGERKASVPLSTY